MHIKPSTGRTSTNWSASLSQWESEPLRLTISHCVAFDAPAGVPASQPSSYLRDRCCPATWTHSGGTWSLCSESPPAPPPPPAPAVSGRSISWCIWGQWGPDCWYPEDPWKRDKKSKTKKLRKQHSYSFPLYYCLNPNLSGLYPNREVVIKGLL